MFATRPAVVAAFLATTVAASIARADGPPGTCECAVTPAAAPAAHAGLPRWGVGLHLASLSLPDPGAMTDRGDAPQYGGAGLQVRYRLTPRWQLELTAAHVEEQVADGAAARTLDAGALAVLFHPRPYARWDWYLLAGVGGTHDADPALTDEARQASHVADVQVGGGVERRFGRVGVAAELRLLARQPADDAAATRMTDAAGGDATTDRPGGGALTVAGTYYF